MAKEHLRVVLRKRTYGCLLRCGAALVCLAAFAFGNANLLPVFTALATSVGGTQEVGIALQADGFCVALRHTAGPDANPRTPALPQQGLGSGTLCGLWAAQGTEPEPWWDFTDEGACEETSADDEFLPPGQCFLAPPGVSAYGWRIALSDTSCRFHPLALLPEYPNAPPA